MSSNVLNFPTVDPNRGLSSPEEDLTRDIIDIALSEKDTEDRTNEIEELVRASKLRAGVRMVALVCAAVYLGTEVLRQP